MLMHAVIFGVNAARLQSNPAQQQWATAEAIY
jgi:hypothetical protein